MLKKLLACTSVVALSMVLANEAKAECNGIYLAGRGGISDADIRDKSISLSGDKLEIDENVLMLSGAIGYRYEYFRAEVEYVWRDDAEDKKTVDFTIPGGAVLSDTSTATFDAKSYMFNVYWDLSPYTWFTPYLNGGIGWTDMKYKFTYTGGSDNYKESNFTWSLGAGISAKMTNRLNLDLGYRYFNYGKMGEAKLDAQEIYGGVRYVF